MKKILQIHLIAAFLIFLPSCYANSFESLKSWKDQKIITILKSSQVHNIEPMREFLIKKGKEIEFDGDVFLATLDNDIKAVFKSFPLDDLGDAYAEVAAYQASLVLGFPHIPPTIIRTINGMVGSLQLFVNTNIDLLAENEYEKALTKVSSEDQANLRIFYFIFGQWDSGPHNLLIFNDGTETYFIAIDNSGIRNHQYVRTEELPFVRILYSEKLNTNDWNKPFPFDKAKVIENPNENNLRQIFKEKLPNNFYKNFKSYNQPLKYIIYQNSLWRQYHAFDKGFIKAIPSYCPSNTVKALQKLDLISLKKIYSIAKNSDFLTPSYFRAILERRDQMLNYCKTLKSSGNT